MLTSTELAKVLISWKKNFGTEIKGHFCVPTNREERIAMFRNLIQFLIEKHSYTEEDLDSASTERLVIEASVNATSERKREWTLVATRDWNDAKDDFFPKEMAEFDSSKLSERSKRKEAAKVEYAEVDPRLTKDNPIDESIFEGLPPVNDPVDEEFMKLLKEVADE